MCFCLVSIKVWQQYLSFPPYPLFEDVKCEPHYVIILMACKKKYIYSIFASDIIPHYNFKFRSNAFNIELLYDNILKTWMFNPAIIDLCRSHMIAYDDKVMLHCQR